MQEEKQNIRKIYSECFERKTLTSGIRNDIVSFADNSNKEQALKKISENQKKCLTIKGRTDKIIFAAATQIDP